MNPNPFAGLLHSRKFWTLILDTVISSVILFGGWYLSPQYLDRVVAVIGIYQPVFIALIAAITAEDNAERKLQAAIYESKVLADDLARYRKPKPESEPKEESEPKPEA